jgi:hypothetical protein
MARFVAAVTISGVLILFRSETLSAQELPAPGLKYLLKDYGARVDWSDTHQLLVYDTVGPDTYFRVATMDKEGGNQKCLTCNHPALPDRHHGAGPLEHRLRTSFGKEVHISSVDELRRLHA